MRSGKWGCVCCCTDLHRQVVGSEGEVVPPDKTWVLRSHVHLQVLEKVNVLLCVYVYIEGRPAASTMVAVKTATLSPDTSYTDMQCMVQACMPS